MDRPVCDSARPKCIFQGRTRREREQELLGLLLTPHGCEQIGRLYRRIKGIPDGVGSPQVQKTLIRHEMIPAILVAEYPNERRK